MRLATAIRISLGLAALPHLALADGYIFVYGYGEQGATDQYEISVDGGPPSKPLANGTASLKLPAGLHKITLLQAGEPRIEVEVDLADKAQRSLQVTLAPAVTTYVVQDTLTKAQLATGSKPVPGMSGTLSGLVTDAAKAPVAGAKVELLGATTVSATTGADGSFLIEAIPPGDYSLAVDAAGYDTLMQGGVVLAAGETVARPLTMVRPGEAPVMDEAQTETLDAINVGGARQGSSEAAVEEERASAGVAEVVSAEQLTRGGETETGAALKRVTGLSLVGGKFVYVRGLGERYSSVLLNGAQIPSPDPLRRVVPLDLFPTEVLDSVVVQKNYSAELPGEFGGGTVMLRTKEAPKKRYAKFSIGGNYVDGTTFKDGLRYDGSSNDFTGYDNSRRLPSPSISRTSTPAQLEAFGEGLAAKGFDTRNENIPLNGSFSGTVGGSETLGDVEFSGLAALRYQNAWDSTEELRRKYATSNSDPLFVTSELNRVRTERNVDASGFVNLAAKIGEGHALTYTSILLRQTADQAQIDEGFTESPDQISRFTELEWVENSLLAHQLGGAHYFTALHDLALDWQVTDARANREAPAKRRYRYDLSNNQFEFSRGSDGNDYVFEDLDDDSTEYRLGAQMPFSYGENWFVNYSAGVSALTKDRASDLRRFKFNVVGSSVLNPVLLRQSLGNILTPANIGPNGFEVTEITRSLDNYNAEQTVDAYYFAVDAAYAELWRLVVGARYERNEQDVSTFDITNLSQGAITAGLRENDWLPSVAITYTINPESQFRFGYSRTLSRPDFRELSPAPFTDPILDIESSGNPDLEQTQLDNLDLRYEYYRTSEEVYSLGVFYKKFDKPIERISVAGTGGILSYDNAESANNYGVELDGFKRLDFISEDWESFFVSANAAYIKSEVELGAAGLIQTSRNRPLQGQSEYLVNLQLGYKPVEQDRLEATLLFNVFGERIAQVGVLGLPDIYETPFNQVDFTLKYKFAPQWQVGLRLRNLLDDEVEFAQGGKPFRLYSPGREVGFSIEWRPFQD